MKNNRKKEELSKMFNKAKVLIRNPEKEKEGEELLIDLMTTSYREIAIFELGLYYQKKENFKKAKMFYETIIKSDNNYKPRAIFELGRINARLGNNKKAKEFFEEVIKHDEKRINNAFFELVELYMQEGDTENALEYLKRMLYSDNPKSRKYAKIKYAHLFINTCEYKMAENILVNLLKTELCDSAIQQLIYLYLKVNKVEEALELFRILPNVSKYYYDLEAYIYYKLGKSKEISLDNYYRKQLIDYDEQLTLEHINAHLYESEEKRVHTLFNSNTNIEKLLQEVKEKIKGENPLNGSSVEKYIVQCDEDVAIIDGEKVNFVEVLTIPDTKNILTMYPLRIINTKKDFKKSKK